MSRIQLRRGTTAEWTAANPVLAAGEPGVDLDTSQQKIGDGVTAWLALPDTLGTNGVAKGELVVNVKDYGAVGDGTADDTAAIIATINAAAGGPPGAAPVPVRWARASVYIPGGYYRITSPISTVSVFGLRIQGAGIGITTLRLEGAFPADALSFVGTPELHLSDMSIDTAGGYTGGTTVARAVVALDFTPTQSAMWGARGIVERLQITNVKHKYGITLGANSATYDLAGSVVRDCHLAGAYVLGSGDTTWYQAAYLSGSGSSGNVLNHTWTHCDASYERYLLQVSEVKSVTATDMHGSFFEEAFRVTGNVPKLHVKGSRIEEARRLLSTGGGTSHPTVVTMESVVWAPGSAVIADRNFIVLQAAGSFTLRDAIVGQDGSASPFTIQAGVPGSGTLPNLQINILLENVFGTWATIAAILAIVGTGKVYVDIRNLARWTAGAALQGSYITQRVAYNGAAGDVLPGLKVIEGSNAKQGVATLVAGTVTVSNTSVTATSRIQLTAQSLGTVTAPKALAVTARSVGTSFTITSADATDTSVVAWEIFEVA